MQNYKNGTQDDVRMTPGDDGVDAHQRRDKRKTQLISWSSLQLKTSALQKMLSGECEEGPQTGRKYLQNRNPTKGWYPAYSEDSENLTARDETT